MMSLSIGGVDMLWVFIGVLVGYLIGFHQGQSAKGGR